MLIEKCLALAHRLAELQQKRTQASRVQALQMRADELGSRVDTLDEAVVQATLYRANGIDIEQGDGDSLGRVVGLVAKVREAFVAAPESIGSGKDYKELLDSVDSISKQWTVGAAKAWGKYARSCLPVVDRSLLTVLGRLANKQAQAENAIEAIDGLRKRTDDPPTTSDELERFEQKLNAVKQLIGTFDMPTDREVTAFVRSMDNPMGASLELLTESVQAWLRHNGLYKSCRIRFMSGF